MKLVSEVYVEYKERLKLSIEKLFDEKITICKPIIEQLIFKETIEGVPKFGFVRDDGRVLLLDSPLGGLEVFMIFLNRQISKHKNEKWLFELKGFLDAYKNKDNAYRSVSYTFDYLKPKREVKIISSDN